MKWRFLVKRNLSILFLEFIRQGQAKKPMKELLDLDFGFDHYLAIENNVCYAVEEIEETNKIVKEMYSKQGPVFLKRLLKKWCSFLKVLEKTSLEISKKDYSSKTNEELIADFEKLKKAYYYISSALYAPIIIENLSDNIIKEKIKESRPEKVEEYFIILTTSEKDNEGTKELKSMLKMAIKLKKGEDISSDIREHIEEFGWINTRGFYGNEWSEEEVLERINSMLKEDLEERLDKLEKHAKEVKENTEKIFSDMKADNEFKEFIEMAKEYVFFRTHRMDAYVKYGFLARPLFREIAERLNLDLQDLWYLLFDEIKDALKTKKDLSELINERKKGFGFLFDTDRIDILTGKGLKEYKEKYMQEKIDKDITEIKGTMASAGYVKGTVKVLAGKHEINKIEKGDILVTSMTTPDFVPAMEKAAAFVTDEGGILCHAAIVSREMQKPCIIGTNIATKVFKDGDLVEVDADKGIVRKL